MSTTSSQEREILFLSNKDIEYSQALVERAKANHIVINCFSVSQANVNMRRIALETGGEYSVISVLNYQSAGMELHKALDKMIPEGSGKTLADTDGDGLPDICEERGIRISNGQIVHLNPNLFDTDQDGISDFIEVGGLPKKETLLIDGETIEMMVSRGGIYDTLSPDFIYVDGRVNADGSVIDEKMDYVSYSDNYYNLKYVNPVTPQIFTTNEIAKGAAGVHGLYDGKVQADIDYARYSVFNIVVLAAITEFVMIEENSRVNSGTASVRGTEAGSCFFAYISNIGGTSKGCKGTASRKYIDAGYMLRPMLCGLNSGYDNYRDHLKSVKYAVEAVLNEYNTDIYLSLSPKAEWEGCKYLTKDGGDMLEYFEQGIINGAALGTFNEASASITVHCSYDSQTEKYWMEYNYYLIDYYDFEKLPILCEQDALGIAQSYELFGHCHGIYSWKAGQKGINIML